MEWTNEHTYLPEFLPPQGEGKGLMLVLWGKKLLMKPTKDGPRLPTTEDVRGAVPGIGPGEYIGRYGGSGCFCARADDSAAPPAGLEPVEFQELSARTGDTGLFFLAGTANHILHWERVNRYCGRCGHPMADKADERAKQCPACGNVVYPRISPATITAVFRGDEILLAHNRNFKEDVHSLIAGFVEPGETLEQCAAREIREEVGIRVRNIRYFSSQPWPFPDSLMVAFTAEYESGDIAVDGVEIAKAAWFGAGRLPQIPSADSIAGKIIRWYRDRPASAH